MFDAASAVKNAKISRVCVLDKVTEEDPPAYLNVPKLNVTFLDAAFVYIKIRVQDDNLFDTAPVRVNVTELLPT